MSIGPCGLCPCSCGCCPRGLCSCPCCLRCRPRGCPCLRCCPCGLCPCSCGCCPRGLCSCPCCLRRRPLGCLRRCPRLHRLQLRLRPRGPCLSSLKKTTRLTQHTPQDFIQRRNRTEHA